MIYLKRNLLNRQKGVALVVVLLVVALVSVIATTLTEHSQREIRRSSNILDYQQARSYALGAEHFAAAVLQNDIKNSPDRDDLSQAWATQGLYYPVEGGDLTGVIKDLNSCFNLNSLVSVKPESGYVVDEDSIAYKAFQRLLNSLALPTELVVSLGDWLDSDEQARSMDGAEDLEYELLEPPYRAANNLIVDVSELRLIQGYSADVINKLTPYICVLPEAGYFKININTLDSNKPELLSMMIKDLPIDTAASILAERSQSGYDDLQSFWQLDALVGIKVDSKSKSAIQLDSDYFKLNAKARIGRGHAGLTSLFKQIDKEKVQLMWRKFGAQT